MNAENFLSGILQNTEACRRILSRIIQWGTVTAVDKDAKKARVHFEDTGVSSDWLPVLQRPRTSLTITPDGQPAHSHPDAYAMDWTPQIGDAVLTIFLPVAHADGFIVGVIP